MHRAAVVILTAMGLFSTQLLAAESQFAICKGEFALCAASSAKLTGNTIMVGGTSFREAVAVCPVLTGESIADLSGGNMKGSCDAPGKGQVWSLFSPVQKFPQAPDWKPNTKAHFRTFVTGVRSSGMSNMFSFACKKTDVVNGTQLADCYGPTNENLQGQPVPVGTVVITEAPAGAPYPVGGPLP